MEGLLRKGKVKEVYAFGNDLRFYFTDQISVFDKVLPTLIPGKGEALCRISAHWFKETRDLVKNHFIRLHSPREMIVRRFDVLNRPTERDSNYLIPLEFITRYFVCGSLYDRLRKGKISPEELGLERGKYGEPLPDPLFEITTKFEDHDRRVDQKEAMEISGLDKKEMEEIKETCLKIDGVVSRGVRSAGLIHVDGKKEFALDQDRSIVVVDTFGTPDEDRFWDLKAYNNDRFIEVSKEIVRKHYRQTGYFEMLVKSRDSGEEEPPIPPLPSGLVKEVSALYSDLCRKIVGTTSD